MNKNNGGWSLFWMVVVPTSLAWTLAVIWSSTSPVKTIKRQLAKADTVMLQTRDGLQTTFQGDPVFDFQQSLVLDRTEPVGNVSLDKPKMTVTFLAGQTVLLELRNLDNDRWYCPQVSQLLVLRRSFYRRCDLQVQSDRDLLKRREINASSLSEPPTSGDTTGCGTGAEGGTD